MYLYEMHLHTSETSRCGSSSGTEQAEFFHRLGYAGIFVTDHFLNGNTLVPRDGSMTWEERIRAHFSGYRAAKERGDELGIKVYAGWEFAYRETEHLSYNLSEEFLLAHPDLDKAELTDYLTLVRENGGFAFQAHPYRAARYIRTIRLTPWDGDGIEAYNANNPAPVNAMARHYADFYGLRMIGGSDIHNVSQKHLVALAFDEEPESPAELFRMVAEDRHTLLDVQIGETAETPAVKYTVLYCGANAPIVRSEGVEVEP